MAQKVKIPAASRDKNCVGNRTLQTHCIINKGKRRKPMASAMDMNAAVDLTKRFYESGNKAQFIEENREIISATNKEARRLLRVGLPFFVRLDQATDEIPVVGGIKVFVKYVGSIAGLVLASITGYNYFMK